MKKLSLLVLLIATTFTSCSSDDDSTSGISEANLIGKWQWTALSKNGEAETLDECNMKNTIEFNANGQVRSIIFLSTTSTGTMMTCEEVFNETGTWSLSEDKLTTNFSDDSTSTIIELNIITFRIESILEFTNTDGTQEKDIFVDTYTRI